MSKKSSELNLTKIVPYLYVILAVIGIVISFWLTYDKIQILKNPNYKPICDISPIISCGDVMGAKQSNILGVPNPIFGMFAFSLLLGFGLSLLAGATFKKWLWLVINTGALVGFIFFVYLFSQGAFVLHAICPFCFVIWMITPPILWYTTLYNLKEGNLKLKTSIKNWMLKHHGDLLLLWYVAIFLTLIIKFWYYWKTII